MSYICVIENEMNIRIFSILLCLLCGFSQSSNAQKIGFSLDMGYHQGIQSKNTNDAPFQSSKAYTLGSGMSRQFLCHIYPDSSNWFFSIGLQNFNGFEAVSAFHELDSFEKKDVQVLNLNSLRALGRLSYSFRYKGLEFNLYSGIMLPLINSLKEESIDYNQDPGTGVTEAKLKNYFTVGYNGGLGIQTQVSKHFKFFVNGDILLMNSNVKSRKITAYSDAKGRTLDDIYPTVASKQVAYKKDVTDVKNTEFLQSAFNANQSTDKLTYSQSFSSIGLQIGILFLF
jgi:hypothetical protein